MEKSTLNGIALAEVAGPISQLFGNLKGPKGDLWLFAFKRFLRRENSWSANPFEQTVGQQLAALHLQNELGGWGISEDDFARLAETAPEWPEGSDAYRSFRIRFGEGREGVIKTFEAHVEAMRRVHENLLRWKLLLSGEHPYEGQNVDRLRLLVGNDSHRPVVEWVVISDLSAHRRRDSVSAVRGPKSFADEGLVIGWLVPDRVRVIDRKEWCAWFCAGYELDVPEDSVGWKGVPVLCGDCGNGAVNLDASSYVDFSFGCSVPYCAG